MGKKIKFSEILCNVESIKLSILLPVVLKNVNPVNNQRPIR